MSRRFSTLIAGLNLRRLQDAHSQRWRAAVALWMALVLVPTVSADEGNADTSTPSASEATVAAETEAPATRGFFPGLDISPRPNLSGRGLLDFQDLFPLSLLHLQLPINTLEYLDEGDGNISVKAQWANTFVTDQAQTLKPFVVDAETLRLELGGFYALRDNFYIGAEAAVVFRGGASWTEPSTAFITPSVSVAADAINDPRTSTRSSSSTRTDIETSSMRASDSPTSCSRHTGH